METPTLVEAQRVTLPLGGPEAQRPTPLRDRLDRHVLAVVVLMGALLALRPTVDPDLPGHLTYGLEHLATGRLAEVDPYSFTVPGARWINHEWAFELTLALAYSVLGTAGLLLLQGLAWMGTGALVLRLIRRGTSDRHAAITLLVFYVALSFPYVSVRPQMMTFLAFATLLSLLEAWREGWRWGAALVPFLFVLWPNLHGGFLAGVGVLGVYGAGVLLDALRGDAGARRMAPLVPPVLLASGAATLLTPYGVELHRWLWWSLLVPNPHITEWRPIMLDSQGIAFGVFTLVVLAAVVRRKALPLAHALPLLASLLTGVLSARHGPFFVISVCAFLPGAFGELYRNWIPRRPGDLRPGQYRVLAGALAAIAVLLVGARSLQGFTLRLTPQSGARWPTAAIQYVDRMVEEERARGLPPRNLLVEFNWAQLAIWRWYPHVRVHYDGRHRTVYPLGIEREHWVFLGLEEGDHWAAVEEADMVLVMGGGWAERRMRDADGWGLAYEDGHAVLYVRGWSGETTKGAPIGSIPFGKPLR